MSPASAPLPSRLASLLYELLLVFAVLAVTFAFPHILLGIFADRSASAGILWAHLSLVLLSYFCWFWLHGGQTLAMKTWRVRLVTVDGRGLTLSQALLRYLLAWPSIGFAGIGLLWAVFDSDRQFLHDRLAGTRLIKTAA